MKLIKYIIITMLVSVSIVNTVDAEYMEIPTDKILEVLRSEGVSTNIENDGVSYEIDKRANFLVAVQNISSISFDYSSDNYFKLGYTGYSQKGLQPHLFLYKDIDKTENEHMYINFLESATWNKENRFTGWTDVDLSEKGIQEARNAGKTLKKEGFMFDLFFTSYLKRAIRTLWLIQEEMDLMWIPVETAWQLNERHYGSLQGLNKADMAKQYGEEQVLIWRRSYDVPPPALEPTDERHPNKEIRYQKVDPKDLPTCEALKHTVIRVLPYWNSNIVPAIKAGKRILIAAHGNSIRALVKYLDNVPDADILKVDIPTGIPLVYELDAELKPIKHYYLGNPEDIEKAVQSVKNQGKAK